jgi:hypothetical protein
MILRRPDRTERFVVDDDDLDVDTSDTPLVISDGKEWRYVESEADLEYWLDVNGMTLEEFLDSDLTDRIPPELLKAL